MGAYLELVDAEQTLRKSATDPVILNDMPTTTTKQREVIDSLICTTYNGTDLFSNEPACACGCLKGGYLAGVSCSICGQPVQDRFDQVLEPLVWMRQPNQVEKLINPMIWIMLDRHFTLRKQKNRATDFSVIQWLTNTDYSYSHRPEEIDELINRGMERGYNNFVRRFDEYMDVLFGMKSFAKNRTGKDSLSSKMIKSVLEQLNKDSDSTGPKVTSLQVLLREYRHCVFTSHLPMVNKALLVIEETKAKTTYVDPVLVGALNAIQTIAAIDDPTANLTVRQRENRTAKALAALAEFYFSVLDNIISSKGGLFRKHIYAQRCSMSTRSVISSLTKPHKYDELEMSWGQGVTLMQVHLQNLLQNTQIEGGAYYTPNEARSILQGHTTSYDPLVDSMLKQLVSDSNDAKLQGTYIRNPSLGLGSVQCMGVSKFKTDPDDPTTGLSALALNRFNADFDGDQMSFVLAADNKTREWMKAFAPHKNIFDMQRPHTLSSAAVFTKPVATTIAHWMHGHHDPAPADKLAYLNELAAEAVV